MSGIEAAMFGALGRDAEAKTSKTGKPYLRLNVRVGEAPSYGLPVTQHDPHSAGADAYFELAKEVAARG